MLKEIKEKVEALLSKKKMIKVVKLIFDQNYFLN